MRRSAEHHDSAHVEWDTWTEDNKAAADAPNEGMLRRWLARRSSREWCKDGTSGGTACERGKRGRVGGQPHVEAYAKYPAAHDDEDTGCGGLRALGANRNTTPYHPRTTRRCPLP